MAQYSARHIHTAVIISARVRERIAQLDLTQADVARDCGVTQGAIAKIAKNDPHRSSILHLLARSLRTSPAYLTGETDDPDSNVPDAPELSRDEATLVDRFRQLDDTARAVLLQLVDTMTRRDDVARTIHDNRPEFRVGGEPPPRRRAAA